MTTTHKFPSQPVYLLGLLLYLVEMIVFAVSLTSLLHLGWRWVSPLYASPLQLSEEQFRLLRLNPNTPGFSKSPAKSEAKYPNPFSPLPGSLISPPKQSPASPAQSSTPINNTSLNRKKMNARPNLVGIRKGFQCN